MLRFAAISMIFLTGLASIADGGDPTTQSATTQSAFVDPFDLPIIRTKHYDIYSDLDPSSLLQVSVRVDRMFEMYREQTSHYAKPIDVRFPLVLYRRLEDYEAAGAPHGSAGIFDGDKLLAVAGDHADARTWHILQHEGFHQFAHAAISADLPPWLDEGLAEYFGEAIFTGDGFVLDLIPDWRRQRIVQSLPDNKFTTANAIMKWSNDEWSRNFSLTNYDQAWAMTHFLLCAEDGAHRSAFETFIKAVSERKPNAWGDGFGHSLDDFDAKWKTWWTVLPMDSTDDRYAQATVATLTSFLARAAVERQTFNSFDAFAAAAARKSVKISDENVLPSAMLDAAIGDARRQIDNGARFTIDAPPDAQLLMRLHCKLHDGTKLVGTFRLVDDQITSVKVTSE